jgi:hypothetical protein
MGVKLCVSQWEEHRLRMLENRVLRKIFTSKWEELTGHWRKLHSEELHDLYSLPNIIQVIKSRRIGLVGHATHIG